MPGGGGGGSGGEEAQVPAARQPGRLLLCKCSELGQRGVEVGMGADWGGGMGFRSRMDSLSSPWAASGVYIAAIVALWSS